MVSFFSIFFFLATANHIILPNQEDLYEFNVDSAVPAETLEKEDVQADVSIRLVNYINVSFGRMHLKVTYINPDSSIRLGRQPNVLPDNQIVHEAWDGKPGKKIQRFFIQEEDAKKIERFRESMTRLGISLKMEDGYTFSYGVLMLFSPLNLMFFVFMTLLLTLSFGGYYVSRLKEIGVLKLCGWSNRRISIQLIKSVAASYFMASGGLALVFTGYILVMDARKVFIYLELYAELCGFFMAFLLIAACIGAIFLENIRPVGAMKHERDNRKIFVVLLVFKLIMTILLIFVLDTATVGATRLTLSLENIRELNKAPLYRVNTSTTPEDKYVKKLNELIGGLKDDQIYNYAVAEANMRAEELGDPRRMQWFRENWQDSITFISASVLDLIEVLDENGKRIRSSDMEGEQGVILLVPRHLKKVESQIPEYTILDHEAKDEIRIIYIPSNQVQRTLFSPDRYACNSIYKVIRPHKELWWGSGNVLLDEPAARAVEDKLEEMGIDKNTVNVESRESEYEVAIGRLWMEFIEAAQKLVINLFAFLLSVFSITVVFLELRKKEIGVHRLFGRFPRRAVASFIILNTLITGAIAVIMNPLFVCLLAIEWAIYGIILRKYIRNRAVGGIKGE